MPATTPVVRGQAAGFTLTVGELRKAVEVFDDSTVVWILCHFGNVTVQCSLDYVTSQVGCGDADCDDTNPAIAIVHRED